MFARFYYNNLIIKSREIATNKLLNEDCKKSVVAEATKNTKTSKKKKKNKNKKEEIKINLSSDIKDISDFKDKDSK